MTVLTLHGVAVFFEEEKSNSLGLFLSSMGYILRLCNKYKKNMNLNSNLCKIT
jgi:hypothetical protein